MLAAGSGELKKLLSLDDATPLILFHRLKYNIHVCPNSQQHPWYNLNFQSNNKFARSKLTTVRIVSIPSMNDLLSDASILEPVR